MKGYKEDESERGLLLGQTETLPHIRMCTHNTAKGFAMVIVFANKIQDPLSEGIGSRATRRPHFHSPLHTHTHRGRVVGGGVGSALCSRAALQIAQ